MTLVTYKWIQNKNLGKKKKKQPKQASQEWFPM